MLLKQQFKTLLKSLWARCKNIWGEMMQKKTRSKKSPLVPKAEEQEDKTRCGIHFYHNPDDSLDIVIDIPLISNDVEFMQKSNNMGTLLAAINNGTLSEEIGNLLLDYKYSKPASGDFVDMVMFVWKSIDAKSDESPMISPTDFNMPNI